MLAAPRSGRWRARESVTDHEIAMEIEERTEGSAVVASLNGRLDGLGARDLEARVRLIVERGAVRVVLDCGRVSYVGSAGLRAFLVCAKHCLQVGGRLSVAALQPSCRSVLEVSGLLSILDCNETIEAALTASDRAASDGGHELRMSDGETALEIEERAGGPAVIVSLNGRLSGIDSLELEATVSTIIERGDCRMVLDCGRMSYVSSFGLRALLLCARNCRQDGGKLVIAALQPECRSVLGMSGFLSIIECHETIEAALAALS